MLHRRLVCFSCAAGNLVVAKGGLLFGRREQRFRPLYDASSCCLSFHGGASLCGARNDGDGRLRRFYWFSKGCGREGGARLCGVCGACDGSFFLATGRIGDDAAWADRVCGLDLACCRDVCRDFSPSQACCSCRLLRLRDRGFFGGVHAFSRACCSRRGFGAVGHAWGSFCRGIGYGEELCGFGASSAALVARVS